MTATVDGVPVREFLANATKEERLAYYAALNQWIGEQLNALLDPEPSVVAEPQRLIRGNENGRQ